MIGRNYPPDIVAEVRLNRLGLVLYRLEYDRDGAMPEACQLFAAGSAEQTLDGSLQFAKMEEAIAPVEADWGNRIRMV